MHKYVQIDHNALDPSLTFYPCYGMHLSKLLVWSSLSSITIRATTRKQPNHGSRLGDAKVAFRVRTNYHKGKWAWQYCIIRRCSWSCRQRQCQQEADTVVACTIIVWIQIIHYQFQNRAKT